MSDRAFLYDSVQTSPNNWVGGGWTIRIADVKKSKSQSILPRDDVFTDLFSGQRTIDGSSVFRHIVEHYVHTQIDALPVNEQRKGLEKIRTSATSVLDEIVNRMRAERKTTNDMKGKTLIDNALDYVSLIRRNPTFHKDHPFDMLELALRFKEVDDVREREWYERQMGRHTSQPQPENFVGVRNGA